MPLSRSFSDGVAHILRGDELALLDVDGAAGAGGSDEQVGLAAEEGRDLQDIDDLSGSSGLRGLMDIGEDGNAGRSRGPCAGCEDLRRGRDRGSW